MDVVDIITEVKTVNVTKKVLSVFAVIALAILIENPRENAIFREIKLGKDGRPSDMYKFRSIVVGELRIIGRTILTLHAKNGY